MSTMDDALTRKEWRRAWQFVRWDTRPASLPPEITLFACELADQCMANRREADSIALRVGFP